MLKTLAESKQQSKICSPVSDPCVPHASVCLCALTVNNNLLYRIKVFAFHKHTLLNHLRPFLLVVQKLSFIINEDPNSTIYVTYVGVRGWGLQEVKAILQNMTQRPCIFRFVPAHTCKGRRCSTSISHRRFWSC